LPENTARRQPRFRRKTSALKFPQKLCQNKSAIASDYWFRPRVVEVGAGRTVPTRLSGFSKKKSMARAQRVCVMGIRVGFSDTEGVVSTFFSIRYQTIIANSREITFARQFSSVSLVHRMDTNIERQFFEVCPFIAIQNRQQRRLSVKLE